MMEYEVTVTTGNLAFATTFNKVFIKLVGEGGQSDRTQLSILKNPAAFCRGAVSSFSLSCPASLGKLVLIELDKQHFLIFPEDHWFPAKVQVKSQEGDTYNFPIYHWITDSKIHVFKEGKGL
ncbi:hypothetical protein LDENG_00282090 [Lucifuga dentata]|nr:hypothetical protein LDENG_00282090 [Lucifuga dentata]